MEFVKPGTYIDFMRHRKSVVGVSLLLVIASIVSVFVPGPNFGIDFRGGTELHLEFGGDVTSGELRETLKDLGYARPDVVSVEGADNEYILRVREVSSMTEAEMAAVQEGLEGGIGSVGVEGIDFHPGTPNEETGKTTVFKIELDLAAQATEEAIEEAVEAAGVRVRAVNGVGQSARHEYAVILEGVGDELVRELGVALAERGPRAPKRVEWVGPKAGAQLRDAAIKALLYAIAFIMIYVAFRFDLRFAPGGVLAMAHDVIITVGIYVLVQKEFNLTTIAALLTILGYSINDTIVVFDRIRENMGRMRDKSLFELINVSTSQMLSRTIVTSGTTLLSVSAFFIWGTGAIRDISFALFIGILIGTYSSVYIAAPVTEWMDRRFFSRVKR